MAMLPQIQGLEREYDWSSLSFRTDCNSLTKPMDCVPLAQKLGPGPNIYGQKRWSTEYSTWLRGPALSAGSVGRVDPL